MAELVVLEFDDRDRAERAWELGQRMSRAGLVELVDEALAWRDDSGQVRVRRRVNRTRAAALGGAACGAAVGMAFLAPVVGLLVGAGGGTIAGRLLASEPLDRAMVRRIAGYVQPGHAVMFALVRRASPAAAEALREFRPMVIRTSMSQQREDAFVRALRGEPVVT